MEKPNIHKMSRANISNGKADMNRCRKDTTRAGKSQNGPQYARITGSAAHWHK